MSKTFLFTQQSVGLGARKTSMVFLAEALASRGWQTSVVTVQLSQLTRLKRNNRLNTIPHKALNKWYDAGTMRGFVWVPLTHPIRFSTTLFNSFTRFLVRLYARQLPSSILAPLKDADLIVIESCVAVALFRQLRRAAPKAKFVYSMSDRLDVVGMHPALQKMLVEDGPNYDLVRVPAELLLDDLPGANSVYIAHGLQKDAFDRVSDTPYSARLNAVLAGDMMLDQAALSQLAAAFPHVQFHYFGRVQLSPEYQHSNLKAYGEVPFETLADYIKFADVGLALYERRVGLEYIAQSSLKAIQYRYCGLPIVTPDFAVSSEGNMFGYPVEDSTRMIKAMEAALACGRQPQAENSINDWNAVVKEILVNVHLPT